MTTDAEGSGMTLQEAVAATRVGEFPAHISTWDPVGERDKYAIASSYHYRVVADAGRWTAGCDELPRLSVTDESSGAALQDMIRMVERAVDLLAAEYGRVPAPVNWESDDRMV